MKVPKTPQKRWPNAALVVSYICGSIAQVGQTFSITEEHANAPFFIGKMVADALSYEGDRVRTERA